MPPACVYTFLLFWRDFFALDVTLVFIGVSVATFFHLAGLFLIWRELAHLAGLFLI